MDNNLMKNELSSKVNVENKSKKIKNKINKSENINLDQKQIENQNNHITNIFNINVTSSKELEVILGSANKDIGQTLKEALKEKPKSLLTESFEEINPFFLANHASKEFLKEQVELLVAKDIETSLKKQAIAKIGFLTKVDLSLLKIMGLITYLCSFLAKINLTKSSLTVDLLKNKMENKSIERKMGDIYREIMHVKKNNPINFETLENLKINNIINHSNYNCFMFSKLFDSIDSFFNYGYKGQKKEEMIKEINRIIQITSFFINEFPKREINNSKKILNEKTNFYWRITSIGIAILKVIY